MQFPILPILPEGSLSESVVVTVWLGVLVVAFFNLRFGWTFSGLVVPGYLVPLFIAKPLAAGVVVLEGVVAYFLVWLCGPYLRRSGLWSNFFGRDRFFALVLASVVVRVAFDGFLLPWVARFLSLYWNFGFDAADNLHSFGLIIVSLVANQFWKPGLRGGIRPLLVSLAATYVLVRYPLMGLTNFNIGNLEYMYSDISSSVLASPKAYIILLVTAYIASRMNLHYAWDYNGILIPSLLALQWYEPLKILTSLAEAWAVYLAATAVLKLPWLQETTIEGARKIVLFFTLALLYKLLVAYAVHFVDPTARASDWFGFGYLLPTLLAVKMHDKKIALRVTRTTFQTSLVGAAGASAIGFALTFLPQDWFWSLGPAAEAAILNPLPASGTLEERLRADKLAMYERKFQGSPPVPSQRDLDAFAAALRHLAHYLRDRSPKRLEQARRRLEYAGYGLDVIEGRYLYLYEHPPYRAWGIYVLDTQAANTLLVSVPAPLEEWATLEAGAYLFRLSNARALAISNAPRGKRHGGSPRVLASRLSFFYVFHRRFSVRNALEVRGYTRTAARLLAEPLGARYDPDGAVGVPTSLWVKASLPPGLRLGLLRELVGNVLVQWDEPPLKNVVRELVPEGFAELFLDRDDRKRLLARYFVGLRRKDAPERLSEERGFAEELLLQEKRDIAPRGSNLYVPASSEVLLFLDEEVIKPLLRIAFASRARKLERPEIQAEARAANALAAAVDYEVILLEEPGTRSSCLVLKEKDGLARKRHWGTYVFRCGPSSNYAVEVPRPLYERQTLEYAVSLWRRLNAGFFLLAGAHPYANADRSADVVRLSNKASLFNAVHQAILRESGDIEFACVQVRALAPRTGGGSPGLDAIVAASDGSARRQELPRIAHRLLEVLEEDALAFAFADGSENTAGYESYVNAQAAYLDHTRNKILLALWLGPSVRYAYRTQLDLAVQNAQFEALGIPTVSGLLDDLLARASPGALERGELEALADILGRYRATQDILLLEHLRRSRKDWRFVRLADRLTGKAFLLAYRRGELLPFAASLTYAATPWRVETFRTPVDRAAVRRFAASVGAFAVVEESP